LEVRNIPLSVFTSPGKGTFNFDMLLLNPAFGTSEVEVDEDKV
jgi:hypothetical protein